MTQSILLQKIAYLKTENQILRSRCPKNVQTTPAERALLVRLGLPLGNAIQEIQDHGVPKYLRNDNGSEFIAKEVQRWLKANQIKRSILNRKAHAELVCGKLQ